ncbi:hypothetical protein RHSIM_Rhsim13G0187300 [Rhododendron simsii]|uniref:Uncharacterized protein n=1 Tax=Rhododendron simsii TaxID=118357 RepID=A0A834G1J4_RHOSS|nr:hypothetical protein RHSIM_Rhsim13G0187300 [Rhododendron simsii]
MHSLVLSEWGFLPKTSRQQKSIKSYVVEAAGEEEGDETDMAKISFPNEVNSSIVRVIFHDLNDNIVRELPHDVENGARLKQRKVALDDAIVEDTPPSKIVQRSSKGPCIGQRFMVNIPPKLVRVNVTGMLLAAFAVAVLSGLGLCPVSLERFWDWRRTAGQRRLGFPWWSSRRRS